MKIVIISDLHGNFGALEALPETYNELWVLGDLVNYGPEPATIKRRGKAKPHTDSQRQQAKVGKTRVTI